MTFVTTSSSISLPVNNKVKYFTVEIVTFDGESYTEEIVARSKEQAEEIAYTMYDNIDYVMIQGCFYW